MIAVCALGLGSVYVEWTETRARGEDRRDEIARKLDAEDPGWRAADICKARNAGLPREEQNAAARALVAAGQVPQAYKDWSKTRHDFGRGDPEPGVRLAGEDRSERIGVHSECSDALVAARSVRTLPPGGHPLTFREDNPLGTLLHETVRTREVAGLLDLDTTVLALTGRPDEAIESVHAILACGRALGDEPTLASQLVRIDIAGVAVRSAERVLGWAQPTRGLADLQTALAEELAVPRLSYGFRGERAMLFDTMDCIDRRQVPLDDVLGRTRGRPGGRVRFVLYRKHLPAQQAMIAELYTAALAADRLSGPDRRAAFDTIRVKTPTSGDDTELVRLLTPRFDTVVAREDRNRALLGCAIAALACERYRVKYGHWPESLAAIPKDILHEVPGDPFSGGPLHYQRTENGIVVSSTRPPQPAIFDPPQVKKENLWVPVEFRLFDLDSRGRQAPPSRAGHRPDPTGSPGSSAGRDRLTNP